MPRLDAASVLSGPDGVIASRVSWAVTARSRMRGLRRRPALDPDEGLILQPCAQIHTFGMRFAIDAVFCDADLLVLEVVTLRPGRMSRIVRGAKLCIELAAGRAEACGVGQGTQLVVGEAG